MTTTRTLVVYFSPTGHTRAVARSLAEVLDAEVEEIIGLDKGHGSLSTFRAWLDALSGRSWPIASHGKNPAAYDLVIIGTPVWGRSLPPPMRAWLSFNRSRLPQVAFFCTHRGSGCGRMFRQMRNLSKRRPLATCPIDAHAVEAQRFRFHTSRFIKKVRDRLAAIRNTDPSIFDVWKQRYWQRPATQMAGSHANTRRERGAHVKRAAAS